MTSRKSAMLSNEL